MTENELKALGAIEIVLTVLFCALLVSGLIPGTYGVYQWLGDNKNLAPWFSGGATTLGVLAALWNTDRQVKIGLEKERRDEARAEAAAERIALGYATASRGVLARTFAAVEQLRNRLIEKPDRFKHLCRPDAFMFLQIQSVTRAVEKFPIHLIGNSYAIEIWYGASIFLETIIMEMKSCNSKFEDGKEVDQRDVDSVKEDCLRVLNNINTYLNDINLEEFEFDPPLLELS